MQEDLLISVEVPGPANSKIFVAVDFAFDSPLSSADQARISRMGPFCAASKAPNVR